MLEKPNILPKLALVCSPRHSCKWYFSYLFLAAKKYILPKPCWLALSDKIRLWLTNFACVYCACFLSHQTIHVSFSYCGFIAKSLPRISFQRTGFLVVDYFRMMVLGNSGAVNVVHFPHLEYIIHGGIHERFCYHLATCRLALALSLYPSTLDGLRLRLCLAW